jgi:hypothetical protein
VGLFLLVALAVGSVGWSWRRAAQRPPSDRAMQALPMVVDRAAAMARERGSLPTAPPEPEDTTSRAVRILSSAPVRPLPFDAAVPQRRRSPRPRSTTPRAVAARRARARRRASQALGTDRGAAGS